VLRTEADRLPDFVDGGLDVEAVDLGGAGRRGKHASQDGTERKLINCRNKSVGPISVFRISLFHSVHCTTDLS
jgi:hypothetical protein